jgi:hypothetical protein
MVLFKEETLRPLLEEIKRMKMDKIPQLSGADFLISLIDELFADFNMGLLIYHLEDANDLTSLKLVYANHDASKYSGVDLQPRVGKYIYDAFPALRETDLPRAFQEVVLTKAAARIGIVEYSDEQMGRNLYSVKAFPIPNQCVGVIFENVSVRKQVDEMLKKHANELEVQKSDLQTQLANLSHELTAGVKQIAADVKQIQTGGKSRFTQKQTQAMDNLAKISRRLSRLVKSLPAEAR